MGRNKHYKAVKLDKLQRNKNKQSLGKSPAAKANLSGLDQELWSRVTKTVRPMAKSDLFQKQNFEYQKTTERVELKSEEENTIAELAIIDEKAGNKTKQKSHTSKMPPRKKGSISILQSLLPESLQAASFKNNHSFQAQNSAKDMSPSQSKTWNKFDRNVYRKIERGRVSLDARIDLHGYTQDEAYYTLLYFIQQSSVSGFRHLLIITGKGKSFQSEGVLQKQLPHWLATPSFRLYIDAVQRAARPHGGEGAYYVRLRRLK